MDPNSPPAVPTSLEQIDMTLNFFPTIAQEGLSNDPFPQFGGRCLEPFLGKDGRNWIRIAEYDGRGGMESTTTIKHPFIPAHSHITAGLLIEQS